MQRPERQRDERGSARGICYSGTEESHWLEPVVPRFLRGRSRLPENGGSDVNFFRRRTSRQPYGHIDGSMRVGLVDGCGIHTDLVRTRILEHIIDAVRQD